MKRAACTSPLPPRLRQRGLSLLEIMIGLTIALFLLAGLFTLFSGTRQTSLAQAQLAQLQDNQRMTMNMLSSVVEHAGFYPTPQTYTQAQALPATAAFPLTGQSITGTSVAGSSTDTLSVRYVADKAGMTDQMLNCNGLGNTSSTGTATFVNTFAIDDQNQLTCSVNGSTALPIVGGVAGINVLYGVGSVTTGSVRRYYTAAQLSLSPALWGNVVSAQITVAFQNPLYVAGQGSAPTIPVTRVISLMGKV